MEGIISSVRGKKTTFIIVGVVSVLAIAVGAYFLVVSKPNPQAPGQESQTASPDVPETLDVVAKIQELNNPVGDNLPGLNPVEKTNPFKDVYKNPFE